MSWGVQAIGRPAAVGEAIKKQFEHNACSEPEETVRQAAKVAVLSAIEAQDPATPISVSASGSQSSTYKDGKWGEPYTNQRTIEVKPLHNFLE